MLVLHGSAGELMIPYAGILAAMTLAVAGAGLAGYYRGNDAADRRCMVERAELLNAIEAERLRQSAVEASKSKQVEELNRRIEEETRHAETKINTVLDRHRSLAAQFDKLRAEAAAGRRRLAECAAPTAAGAIDGAADNLELSGKDVEFLVGEAAEAERNTLKLIQLQTFVTESRRIDGD